MHLPPVFRLDDPAAIDALVRNVGLAILVGAREDGGIEVTHVPLVLRRGPGGSATLVGHVARASATWRVLDGRPVTAIFQGPHAYVSAGVYTRPEEEVPTWSYVVVHAEGTLHTTTGPELRADLGELVSTFEGPTPRWSLETMRPELLAELEGGIVGLRVDVRRITAKAKVSQNRSPEDRARVRAMLAERGDTGSFALVAHMDAAEARRASS